MIYKDNEKMRMEKTDELIEEIMRIEEEYGARLSDMENRVDMMEEFLIRYTRGYYLKTIKKDSYR